MSIADAKADDRRVGIEPSVVLRQPRHMPMCGGLVEQSAYKSLRQNPRPVFGREASAGVGVGLLPRRPRRQFAPQQGQLCVCILERPDQRLASGVLPQCAGFAVTHDHIAPPNTFHIKMQMLPIHAGGIHDAAAAGFSPRHQNWLAADGVVNEVMRDECAKLPRAGIAIVIHIAQHRLITRPAGRRRGHMGGRIDRHQRLAGVHKPR